MRTNRQKKGEQTETQVFGNCLYYLKERRDRTGFFCRLDNASDEKIENICSTVSIRMKGDLSFENWKKAVDETYPI
jgi:hypothetical protein